VRNKKSASIGAEIVWGAALVEKVGEILLAGHEPVLAG
jgi:hypothetical protein